MEILITLEDLEIKFCCECEQELIELNQTEHAHICDKCYSFNRVDIDSEQ